MVRFSLLLCLVALHQASGFAPHTAHRGVSLPTLLLPIRRRHDDSQSVTRNHHHHHVSFNDRFTCRQAAADSSLAVGGESDKNRDSNAAATRKPLNPILSAAVLFLLDVGFRRVFRLAQISFPSSLGGCGIILALLLSTTPSDGPNQFFALLQPGAQLLAKWLPVFFVPTLVTLPLREGLGSAGEVAKVGAVIVGGFLVSLWTTAASVVAVRRWTGKITSTAITATKAVDDAVMGEMAAQALVKAKITKPTSQQRGPFSNTLYYTLVTLTTLCGAGVVGGDRSIDPLFQACKFPLTTVYFLLATLSNFVTGTRLPKRFTKAVHPLVTCTTLTWAAAALLGSLTQQSFRSMLLTYRTGSLVTGAGDLLLFCLGPAVVSLAVSMYERRKLMRENVLALMTAIGVSTIFGVFGTAAAVRFLDIGSPSVRLSLLSRNITSPLAMAMANVLGADVSFAVSIVVITGLLGANFGAALLSAAGIRDPVARGLGIGAAAHGLGTAAFVNEKDAFPFAAIAMALTASAATVAVSIPFLRSVVLRIALGW